MGSWVWHGCWMSPWMQYLQHPETPRPTQNSWVSVHTFFRLGYLWVILVVSWWWCQMIFYFKLGKWNKYADFVKKSILPVKRWIKPSEWAFRVTIRDGSVTIKLHYWSTLRTCNFSHRYSLEIWSINDSAHGGWLNIGVVQANCCL